MGLPGHPDADSAPLDALCEAVAGTLVMLELDAEGRITFVSDAMRALLFDDSKTMRSLIRRARCSSIRTSSRPRTVRPAWR